MVTRVCCLAASTLFSTCSLNLAISFHSPLRTCAYREFTCSIRKLLLGASTCCVPRHKPMADFQRSEDMLANQVRGLLALIDGVTLACRRVVANSETCPQALLRQTGILRSTALILYGKATISSRVAKQVEKPLTPTSSSKVILDSTWTTQWNYIH